jgi:D-sedoheptulose 7-phosphate isomerase
MSLYNKQNNKILESYINDHKWTFESFSYNLSVMVIQIADMILTSLKNGGTVYTMGNGGSASDAMHFVGELVGRFEKDRIPLRAACLNTNVSNLTAIGNDYGYESVFEREVLSLVKENDVVIGFTTSGESKNIIKAFTAAKKLKATIICFTGHKNQSTAASLADRTISVPSSRTSIIQEHHIIFLHMLAKIIEENFDKSYDGV